MPFWGNKPKRTWLAALLAFAGATVGVSASLAALSSNPTPVCVDNVCTVTFSSGNEYSFTKPANVPLTITLSGGAGGKGGNDSMGGSAGRNGDRVSFTVDSKGTPLAIYPGGAGGGGGNNVCGTGGGSAGASAYPNGGYAGGRGGNAGPSCSSGAGGGGGAASVIAIDGLIYVAAGGSGGGGGDQFCAGPPANAYALANSTANTFGSPGGHGTGDGSGAGGGGGGVRGGAGGGVGSCGSESLGYGGYSGSTNAPAGATTTFAANAGNGSVTISYPDKVNATLTSSSTLVSGTSASFNVVFDVAVSGLTASDFSLAGSQTGCAVTAVSGSGTDYQVTVAGCPATTGGTKTLILTLPAGSVADAGSRTNALATAQTVTFDQQKPVLTISAPNPYAERTYFDFTVTGTEPLAGFDLSDFTLSGGSCKLDSVSGNGAVITVRVIGCTHLDVTKLTIKAGSITDLAGNPAPPSALTSANQTVNIPAAPATITNTTVSGEQSTGVQQGITLTMNPATFSPAGRNVITTTWYRCYSAQTSASASLADDCQQIAGATSTSYQASQNDIGYYLRGVATATNASGTVISASANTAVVRETDVLSATWRSTCVIKEGLVYCWGENQYGQMGSGTTTDLLSPPTHPIKLANGNYLTGVVSVDTASEHSCALTFQGAMYCWGRNNWSQLGDGTTVAKSVATPVTATATGGVNFSSDVVGISAGEAHTCALKVGGAAFCWGYNDYGQLGDGTTTTRIPPTRILTAAATPLTHVTDIELNRYNACALSNAAGSTGQVYCTGYNGNGAVGDGTTTNRSYAVKVLSGVGATSFAGVTDISVGSHTICAVQAGASLCWGYNNYGQLGNGTTTNSAYPTAPNNTASGISFASGVVQVETSKDYQGNSCFLKEGGVLYCTGLGSSGQLADGTAVNKSIPVTASLFAGSATTASLGLAHVCVLDTSGVNCVGYNSNGQLGNGVIAATAGTTKINLPIFNSHMGAVDESPVPGANTLSGFAGTGQLLTGATTVEAATGSWYGYPLPALSHQWLRCSLPAGPSTTLPKDCAPIPGATALTYTATSADVGSYLRFQTTGTNFAGTTMSLSSSSALVGVAPTNSGLPVIKLNAGSAGAIEGYSATVSSGDWSGNPTPTISYKWFRCSGAGVTSTLSLPSDCTYITDATGVSYKFTASDVGYYIRGVEVASSSAGVNLAYTATVGPIGQSRVIAAGFNHTCVIKLGFVYCWGYNGYGNLGDGTTTSTNSMPATPVKLADGSYLKNVESIDASANSTCALTAAGAMYCWGYNGYGELGDGTTTNRSVPTLVSGLSSGVSYMMTSVAHTCAVKTNGSLYCWGLNDNGQVGDNTSTQRNSPVQVITAPNTPIADVIQVSGGWKHTCAIKVGGALFCWGYNGNGMVGDNSVSSRWMPTAVVGMSSGVTDVSAGYYNTCAVKNGAAWCWGYNGNGQLGDGTVTQRQVPVAVVDSAAGMTFASGVWDVESSDYDPGYTCFTKQSGRIYCTGGNAQGQLGTGNTTEFNKPTAPALFPGTVTASALGRYHTCVIMDAKVSCIGYNVNGELGNGANTSTSTVLATQTAFGNPGGAIDVLPVSGGATQTGYVGVGQTVTGATTLDSITGTWAGYSYPTLAYQWLRCNLTGAAAAAVPSDCTPISGATSLTYTVTAGDNGKYLRFEVLGTNSVGTVIAVSANSAAVGATPANTVLPGIASSAGYAGSITGNVATVSAGTWTGTPTPSLSFKWYRCAGSAANATTTTPTDCVIIAGATGANYTYTASDVGSYIRGIEVAESTSGISYAYTASVGPVRQSDELTSGINHTCAIELGLVYCWGYNNLGQLGDGTTNTSTSIPSQPVKLADGTYLKNVVSISAGSGTTCALTIPGAVYCWGNNQYGQLGDGTTTNRYIPTPVASTTSANGSISFASGVTAIAVGTHQTCAVKNGAVYCWGWATNGNLGDGSTVSKSVPTPSLVLTSGVTQINSQDQTTCAVKAGALYCWGYNAYGQLVDGSTTSKSTPAVISQMSSGVTDVDLGFYNVCAIKNGAAFCWGYNYNYVLGDGTATNRAVPTPVATSVSGVAFDSQVVDVTVSDHHDPSHACAIKQDGKAYCWGDNTYGQLGDLTTNASSRPVFATGFSGKVSATAMTALSTCMVVDGAVKCAGYNANGQLGNGTTTNTATPFGPTVLSSGLGAFDVLPTAGPASITGYAGTGETLTGATAVSYKHLRAHESLVSIGYAVLGG
jgi:alpha-tubulin suppressor-like RCC1 family protein